MYRSARNWLMSSWDLTEDQAITLITVACDFNVHQVSSAQVLQSQFRFFESVILANSALAHHLALQSSCPALTAAQRVSVPREGLSCSDAVVGGLPQDKV